MIATELLRVTGVVQGVGFRPYVFRLANTLGLRGWVRNDPEGVLICLSGEPAVVEQFKRQLQETPPPAARIRSLKVVGHPDSAGVDGLFSIQNSTPQGECVTELLPDLATCPDCLREVLDVHDRRHGYPFANCTNCGPRFSILRRLPYDRPHTTMAEFAMCPDCAREYRDPQDRRFHAQPIACPVCGPQLQWADSRGVVSGERHAALEAAVAALRAERVVAVKGLGGFHLMVAAGSGATVRELRRRKRREEKPLAVMAPDLAWAQRHCVVTDAGKALLTSMAAPIVLLRVADPGVCAEVAPGNPYLGVMLPYTPLHHLLLRMFGGPLVATSGNLTDEPICIDNAEALQRLQGIADFFLLHNRPIVRPMDDSVAQVVAERPMLLRRGRGYAPFTCGWPDEVPAPVLAVGGHLKNTVALAHHRQVVVSPHVGDLDTLPAHRAFQEAIASLRDLLGAAPAVVLSDEHPDYHSTGAADRMAAVQRVRVQHHHAHVAACLAEQGLHDREVLGIAWDGTGYGLDDSIWGGEFLVSTVAGSRRVASFWPFRLPGGEKAVREPRRAALGVLWELWGDQVFARQNLPPVRSFQAAEQAALQKMLASGSHAPLCSSAGRLFDAVAAILDLCQVNAFEAQAAMRLQFAAEACAADKAHYEFEWVVAPGGLHLLDWRPMLLKMLEDLQAGVSAGLLAARFHRALAEMVVAAARRFQHPTVALCGGCFQNRLLATLAIEQLTANGFEPVWPSLLPPNDGGIAFGQAAAWLARKPTAP